MCTDSLLSTNIRSWAANKGTAGMKINAAWHEANPMPKNPTFEQRVAWHLAHQQHCSCRPIPPKLVAAMKKEGLSEKSVTG